jgi:hypothetical protein
MTLTPKQHDVLLDVITTNDPWFGIKRGDGRRVKLLSKLLDGGLITISYNGSLAWATSHGVRVAKARLQKQGRPSGKLGPR